MRLEDLGRLKVLPFSSISDIAAIVDDLAEQLAKLRGADGPSEVELAELQSRMLKSDVISYDTDSVLTMICQPI